METIKAELLKEGMRFSAPLFFDDGKNMFLAEKKPLTDFHLETLARWKIPYVVTYGKPLATDQVFDEEAEELEELEELESVSSSFATVVRKKLTDGSLWQFYAKAVKNMQKVYAAYDAQGTVDKNLVDDSVKSVYRLVSDDKAFALSCVSYKFEKRSFYPVFAVDAAVLSAVLALEMALPQRTVIHCITAALLHKLEASAVASSKSTAVNDAAEKEKQRICPQKTARFAAEVLMYPREVIVIIMQHCEHWDGTGYPEGRCGKDIDVGARVLSVCDAFYVMITQKPEGQRLLAYDAVKRLLDSKEKEFDSAVLKAFVRSVGLYPPGTFVLLNDSSIAQVVHNNPDAPFVPSVQIILSSSKENDKTGQLIDLNVQKSVFIVRAIYPEETAVA